MPRRAAILAAFLVGCAPALSTTKKITPVRIDPAVMSAMNLAGLNPLLAPELDSIISTAIAAGAGAVAAGRAPGGAVAIGRNGHLAYLRAYGRLDWDSAADAVADSSLYDMASLT